MSQVGWKASRSKATMRDGSKETGPSLNLNEHFYSVHSPYSCGSEEADVAAAQEPGGVEAGRHHCAAHALRRFAAPARPSRGGSLTLSSPPRGYPGAALGLPMGRPGPSLNSNEHFYSDRASETG